MATTTEQVQQFIKSVSDDQKSVQDVTDMSIREIWAYSKGKGYALTRTDFVDALKAAVSAKQPLPKWLQERIDAVRANWLD